ncbi:MAG: hypothetical protein IK104_12060 [Clostridia bacterium]|nr:hypothetical protein [Clostridia bacterium]
MSDLNTRPGDEGIAFGGGTDNDFVREFEERRTAARESGGTDGMIREEIMSIRPRGIDAITDAEKPKNGVSEWDALFDETPYGSDILLRDVYLNDVPVEQHTGFRLDDYKPEPAHTGFRLPDSITSFSYLGSAATRGANAPAAQPLPEDVASPDEEKDPYIDELSDDEEEEEYEDEYDYEDEDLYDEIEKPRGFKGVFSENAFLSTTTIILGVICAAFDIVFFITLFMRDIMFGNALSAFPLNGYSYTVTFDSPLLTLLKILLYLVPFAAIFFGAALIVTDKNKQYFGKKMMIVLVVLLLIAVACTGYDMSFSHLLF